MKKTFVITQGGEALRGVCVLVYQFIVRQWAEVGDRYGLKVTVQTANIRNLEQNALMWALLADLTEQLQWYGQDLTADEWKDLLTAGLRKTKVVPNVDGTGFVLLGMRTSDMSKKEMVELIEFIYAFGAERGVRFGERQGKRAGDMERISA